MAEYTSIVTNHKKESCLDGIISLFSNCFNTRQENIQIDGKIYKISKLIGEGGFSFVYLAKNNEHEYAIKKINIQVKDQLDAAKWEIHVMNELHKQHQKKLATININNNNNNIGIDNEEEKDVLISDNDNNNKIKVNNNNYIVKLITHTIVRHDKIPEFKIVYMVFPYYKLGNLVSVIQNLYDNNINYMDELRILNMFYKILYAVNELHTHIPSWSHRDIKLDNILLDTNDNPYLMDFGSVGLSHIKINTRKEAMELSEWVQGNMTGAYTPPELFDIKSKFTFDERTDVWALGCLLYAMGFGKSPFDTLDQGSAALAVLSGNIEIPDNHPYSPDYIKLITWMLSTKMKHRPFVPQIIKKVRNVINKLNKIK